MDKTTVGNLCKPYIGQLKLDDNTLIDYFDIASVDNIEKQITGYTTYKFAEAPSRARKKVEKGNILVSTVRPNLNAVALFDEETENMPVASTGFCVLECKANTSPRFLFRYLQSQSFVRAMVSQATGASYPAVSDKIVRDTKLPAYSYEEQIQIANVLDATANIISKRKHQLQKLDELVKARFVEFFGDMVYNQNGWKMVNLGSVCDVRDGTHDSPKYFSEGYPLVTSKNVTSGRIDFAGCSLICKEDYDKINERSRVDFGDILMPMIGTVGKPVIVDVDVDFAIKNVALIKFYENSMVINFFVRALLQSDYFDHAVISKIRGGTQKFIALSDIRKLEIYLPPMDIQKKFAAFVEQTDKSKVAVQKALDEAQLLFDSLMQKYFE